MLIALGCDHGGYIFKEPLIKFLGSLNHKVIDCGCFSPESCDYTDFAVPVAQYVGKKKCERGILICGTGVGMSIAANKVYGVRAAVCYCDDVAKLVAEHNNANILCLSGRFAGREDVFRWTKIWLETPFSSEDRHRRRVEKIVEIDRKFRNKT